MSVKKRYQLVLQFDAVTIEDYDQLIEIENKIMNALGSTHVVDGHDFGSGQMNIYIHTNKPKKAFEIIKHCIMPNNAKAMKAVFSKLDSENYIILWPVSFEGEFKIVKFEGGFKLSKLS